MNTETENVNEACRPAANPDRSRREFDEDASRRELLELLFTHVANPIFLTESDGRIIDVNPAACAVLGFAREELLGILSGLANSRRYGPGAAWRNTSPPAFW
jgi:PAS domain-containing protein